MTTDYIGYDTFKITPNFVCKICGFTRDKINGDPHILSRFDDVCGKHSCRIKAKVCDCLACKPNDEVMPYRKHFQDVQPTE